MRKTPRKLYHYCSVESFFKIVQNKSIWLSNSNQMNDARESVWIEQYFDLIKDNFHGKVYDEFLKYLFLTYQWNKNYPFLFCLSEVKDSLGQWRAYSADGKGLAIAFNTQILNLKNELPSPNFYLDNTIGLVKVEYKLNSQKKIILQILEEFKEMHDRKDEFWELASTQMATLLVDHSLIFKNPSFAEEKEWRIIHTPVSMNYSDEVENQNKLSEIKFRTFGSKITTYFELDLHHKFNSKLIPEIIVGPKSELDIQILRKFLDANNLKKTLIKTSTSTYK